MSICVYLLLRENDENYYQTFSHDGITVHPEYSSIIHTNNSTAEDTGGSLIFDNSKERNKYV